MKYVPARRNSYLFDDLFDEMFPNFNTRNTALMKTDIREKDGKYLLDIDLPGYQKEDIKISIFNGNLTINAEHNESNEEKDAKGNILRKERYSGSCSRTFYVGDAIRESDIHASFNNGILTIDFPSEAKKQEEETKYIDIL